MSKSRIKSRPKSESGKSSAAVSLGRKGGVKGGPARAQALSQGDRSRIARMGGQARMRQKRGGGN